MSLHKAFYTAVISITLTLSYGQELTMFQTLGTEYYKDSIRISHVEVMNLMREDENTSVSWRNSRHFSILSVASFIGYGYVLFKWSDASYFSDFPYFGVSIGTILFSSAMSVCSRASKKNAVLRYNRLLDKKNGLGYFLPAEDYVKERPILTLGQCNHGLGLTVHF